MDFFRTRRTSCNRKMSVAKPVRTQYCVYRCVCYLSIRDARCTMDRLGPGKNAPLSARHATPIHKLYKHLQQRACQIDRSGVWYYTRGDYSASG